MRYVTVGLVSVLVLTTGCYLAHGRGEGSEGPNPPDGGPAWIDGSGGGGGAEGGVLRRDGAGGAADTGAPDSDGAVPHACMPARGVDLLVVIDDSGSFMNYRASIERKLGEVIRDLLTPRDADRDGVEDWPALRDIHLGVVSTSVDAGAACPPTPDGRLSMGAYADPEVCRRIPYPRFLAFDPEMPSDVERLTEDFQCMAMGTQPGCMVEQPLEAMLKALLPSDTAVRFPSGGPRGSEENADFVRDDSVLVVLVIADEDDCSLADPSTLLADDAGTGAEIPHPDGGAPAASGCETGDGLTPIARYADALATLRPGGVVFGVLSGVPDMLTVDTGDGRGLGPMLADGRLDGRYACVDSGGTVEPARRLVQAGHDIRGPAFAASICRLNSVPLGQAVAEAATMLACDDE